MQIGIVGLGRMGANIASVVRADLTRSGLFRSIDPKAFVEHITNINVAPTARLDAPFGIRSIRALLSSPTPQVSHEPPSSWRVAAARG